jgi:hypothetical protein
MTSTLSERGRYKIWCIPPLNWIRFHYWLRVCYYPPRYWGESRHAAKGLRQSFRNFDKELA